MILNMSHTCTHFCNAVGAMVLSTLSVFLIWTVPNTNGAVVGVSCVFSAVTVTVFGSLDVILMNIYDVRVR